MITPHKTLTNSRRSIAASEAPDRASCRLKLSHRKRADVSSLRVRHVRFGSKADIGPYPRDNPLYPQKRTLKLSRMMSALCQKRTSAAYSITSSASNCIEFGNARPSALAVFTLITSSNLLAAERSSHVRFVPIAEVGGIIRSRHRRARKAQAAHRSQAFWPF
jgi:hypothetical protein